MKNKKKEVGMKTNRIYDILESKGMSQKDFARLMGKTETEVSRWLSGTHNLPTFIVKTKDVNLIVECQDFDADGSGNKEAKRHYLKDYWIPAANNLKTFGRWQLLEVRDIDQLESEILRAI